jgi:hypothetical protein
MNMAKRRKLEYLGHIMRNYIKYKLLKSILQGEVIGDTERTRKKEDITGQEPEDMVFKNNLNRVV